jgi:CheY-like chemotaxis protein
VTGSTDLETAGAGANAVLGKPFTIEELEETVARLAASRL